MTLSSWRGLLAAVASALSVSLAAASPALAVLTDVVVMRNGDRITGEVKGLTAGRLQYKTDDMGTIYIEWLKIAQVTSSTTYQVETAEAMRFVGRIEARGDSIVAVIWSDGEAVLPHDEVVRMTRLDAGFWKRLEGSFDLGFTYTQADTTAQFNVDFEVQQRRPNHQTTMDVSGILTHREQTDSTRRFDATFSHLGLRRSKWFSQTFASAQGNEELGLDLRVLVGAGYGITGIQTNRTVLRGAGGLAAKEEWPSNGASEEELEAFLAGAYSFFTFDYPNTKVDVSLSTFHGLSGGGLRVEGDISVRRELVRDFYVSLGVYESYDEDPIVSTAAQNDWGLTTSVGWSF